MRIKFIIALLSVMNSSAMAQSFNNIEDYCTAMSEASTSTLLARTQGISKQQSIDMMQGMTDQKAIRMVQEVINFAYSRPENSQLNQMRAELRQLCIARKIFTQ